MLKVALLIGILLCLGLMLGCATPRAPLVIEPRLRDCPDAAPAPAAPPAPRAPEALVKWGTAMLTSRDQTAAALAECRRRLLDLNSMVEPQ